MTRVCILFLPVTLRVCVCVLMDSEKTCLWNNLLHVEWKVKFDSCFFLLCLSASQVCRECRVPATVVCLSVCVSVWLAVCPRCSVTMLNTSINWQPQHRACLQVLLLHWWLAFLLRVSPPATSKPHVACFFFSGGRRLRYECEMPDVCC